MNVVWIPGVTMIFVVLLMAVVAWLTPRWTPEGFAFGVPVSAQWRASAEARVIERGFRARALVGAALALGVAIVATLWGWIFVSIAPPFVSLAGLTWAYGWAYRRTRPHAVEGEGPRVASARHEEPLPAVASIAAQAVPFGVLALAALSLAARWSDIPERFPIHWNASGTIDRWGSRDPVTVFLPLAIGAAICATLYVLLRMTMTRSRRGAPGPGAARVAVQRTVITVGVFGAECLIAVVQAGLSLLPLVARPHLLVGSILGVTGVFALALPIWMTVMVRRLPRGAAAAEARPPETLQHWKWGLFYVNRDDPAVFVEKRFGFGYTVNLARPLTWVLFALLLLPGIVATAFGILTSRH